MKSSPNDLDSLRMQGYTLPSQYFGIPMPDQSAPPPLPPVLDWADFMENPPEVPPELIGGVLHQGSKMILAGSSKTYKTWILLHMGLSVAHGRGWWGFPTAKTKVLYVNFELKPFSVCKRLADLAMAMGVTPASNRFHIWNLRGHSKNLGDLKDQLIRAAEEMGCGLIILDPIYKLLGIREENSNTQITQMLNELDEICEQTGAALIFGHHFSKGNQSGKLSIDRASGAGAWARDPDSIMAVTQHQEPDCFTIEMTLRNFPPQQPFVVQREHPIMERRADLDPEELKVPGSQSKFSVDKLVELLPPPPTTLSHGDWKERAMRVLQMSEGTFSNYRRKAEDSGKAVKAADGKWHRGD